MTALTKTSGIAAALVAGLLWAWPGKGVAQERPPVHSAQSSQAAADNEKPSSRPSVDGRRLNCGHPGKPVSGRRYCGAYGGYLPYGYDYAPGYGPGAYAASEGASGASPGEMGYADGFDAGRSDRIRGNLYDPRQYERSGDPEYFEAFVAGYENGYRR